MSSSTAIGLLAGRFAAAESQGEACPPPPGTTALGALLAHITGGHLASDGHHGARSFQPMNVNYGLFPEIAVPTRSEDGRRFRGKEKSQAKKRALSERALRDLEPWLAAKAS